MQPRSLRRSPAGFGITNTTHTLTGLTNGTAYQFRVAAINSAGAGPASTATGSLTPVAPPPPPPTTPPTVIPAATLAVTARSATAKVARKGKATLVRVISTGPGQTITTTVKVAPGAAKKKVKVTKTPTSVTVLTKKSPKASITVTITASGPGVTPTTWTRTWKVRRTCLLGGRAQPPAPCGEEVTREVALLHQKAPTPAGHFVKDLPRTRKPNT